jgi:hypothetical protein
MNAFLRSSAIIALTSGAIAFISEAASAQTVIHVDIVNGSLNPTGNGEDGWGADAYKFLQDALDRADVLEPNDENPVEIWVAAGTYVPDQDKVTVPNPSLCSQQVCFGDGDRERTFHLRDNVRILGGFDGTEDFEHERCWITNITILSGDLKYDDDFQVHKVIIDDELVALGFAFDNYEDNSQHVVTATMVGSTAVLDGFIIQGGIELRGAQPLFRDCVFALHEGAAVRCVGGSHVMLLRCTFTGTDCDAIIVDEGSRLALLACEPADALNEAHRTGKARVASCSVLLVVDRAAMMR